MRVLVVETGGVVVLQAEATVEFPIEPYFGRVVVLHQHPLPDIEFPLPQDQRVLDVFLHHILRLLAERVIQDVGQLRQALDTATARED